MKYKRKPLTERESVSGSNGGQIVIAECLQSEANYNTKWCPAQGVSALLLEGEENAISMRDLTTITGLSDRELRALIQRERRAGVPILANQRTGLYMPSSEAEKCRWVRGMLHRGAEIVACARAVLRGPEDE